MIKEKAQSDFPQALSAPALRGLGDANIRSLKDLGQHTEDSVASLHGLGPKAMEVLKSAMKSAGLKFKTT